jgi:hypothetical protein
MTSPVTTEPAESAAEARGLAEAFALAVTVETVTSPPKMLTVEISAEPLELADDPGDANAPEVTDPVLTTEPSAG